MTMTADPEITETTEQVEEINFDTIHALCRNCYPMPRSQWVGKEVRYACGHVGVERDLKGVTTPVDDNGIPLNACQACLDMFNHAKLCPICGYTG